MNKSVLLTVMAMMAALSLHAQSSFTRIYGGFAMATMKDSEEADKGFVIGTQRDLNLIESVPLYLQPGLEFSYLTAKPYVPYVGTFKEKLANFAIPLNLSYRLGNDHFSFEPYAGLNCRLNILGKAEFEGDNSSLDQDFFKGEYKEEAGTRRFQFGANIGFFVNYLNFAIGYRWNPDITDYYKKKSSKTSYHFLTVACNIFD